MLRFAQGIGVGGEWGGAVLMAVEHAPKGRRGFFGSWPQMGVPAGLLLSTLVFLLVQGRTSEAAFASWGWRIPFLASAILVIVGLVIRLKLMESPAFERVKETETEAKMPIVDVVRKYPRNVLTAMGMRVGENGVFYLLTVFVLRLRRGGARPREEHDADRRGHRRGDRAVHRAAVRACSPTASAAGRCTWPGAVVTTLWAFPFFGLMDTKSPVLIWLAVVVGVNIGHDLMYGPQAAYFAELFGTRVRYSGASLGYQLASVFAGGFAPLIATALLASGGSSLVALYITGLGLISVVATLFARETYKNDIDEDDEQERELVRERRFDRERFRDRETAGSSVSHEQVFTLEATPLKFGRGAAADAGWELERLGVKRAMLVSDPGVVAAGITDRVRERIEASGIETELWDSRARGADGGLLRGGRRVRGRRRLRRLRRDRRRVEHRHRQGRRT